MGITLNYDEARSRLSHAIDIALSNDPLPSDWLEYTEMMWASPSATYVPALGTGLLARATDSRVDALSLKENSADDAYSARTLCHNVLVPASKDFGFSLRTKGREPLNNQPFFRYDRISPNARVHQRSIDSYKQLIHILEKANSLTLDQALLALAAFLRVCFKQAQKDKPVHLRDTLLRLKSLIDVSNSFLAESLEGGKRPQALVAAIFGTVYDDVRTQRVNDPSRDHPGDVTAFEDDRVIVSVEVRAKPVSVPEAKIFTDSLVRANIGRGVIVALHPSQESLTEAILEAVNDHDVLLSIYTRLDDLVYAALSWSPYPIEAILAELPDQIAQRLVELEVDQQSLQRWVELCRLNISHESED